MPNPVPPQYILRDWLYRYLGNTESMVLLLTLVLLGLGLYFLGGILAPVLAALVIAFVFEGTVDMLERMKFKPITALIVTYVIFLLLLLLFLLMGIPLLDQFRSLLSDLPGVLNQFSVLVSRISADIALESPGMGGVEFQVQIAERVRDFSQMIATWVLGSIPQAIIWLAYLLLIPFFVLFFLRDRGVLPRWVQTWLPEVFTGLMHIWHPLRPMLEGYVRGKSIEIVGVAVVSGVAFEALGMNYSGVVGMLCGLSVLLPYVGLIVATVLVALLGFSQFGAGLQLVLLLGLHGFIQIVDGYVLAPWLFATTVRLHPAVVLGAVILFGGLWGLWGAFFAIPVTLLLRELFLHWPTTDAADTMDTGSG